MSGTLMLASPLYTPINLSGIISDDDLKPNWSRTGLTSDHHVTIIYDKNEIIDQDDILDDLQTILGSDNYEVFMTFMKDDYRFRVTDIFTLDVFENDDHDYLVLLMNKNNELYRTLLDINKGLSDKYEIKSDYSEYNPHVTLAELNPGTGNKYLSNKSLELVLRDSTIEFQDLVFNTDKDPNKSKLTWSITTYHTLERLFKDDNTVL